MTATIEGYSNRFIFSFWIKSTYYHKCVFFLFFTHFVWIKRVVPLHFFSKSVDIIYELKCKCHCTFKAIQSHCSGKNCESNRLKCMKFHTVHMRLTNVIVQVKAHLYHIIISLSLSLSLNAHHEIGFNAITFEICTQSYLKSFCQITFKQEVIFDKFCKFLIQQNPDM